MNPKRQYQLSKIFWLIHSIKISSRALPGSLS